MWNQPEIKINLTLIRHGKTPSNKEHRYLGVTEEALSEDGRKQLEILAEKDILRKPWLLFISPMLRCQESAGILFPGKKAYPIEEWREMNFGAYEGKNYEDLKNDSYYQKWIDSNGTIPFPQGEDIADFRTRCVHAWNRVVNECMESGVGTAACIVHGGTIMAVLSEIYGGGYYDYHCGNGDGYICNITQKGHISTIKKITEK